MRKLITENSDYVEIVVKEELGEGEGGVCHEYFIGRGEKLQGEAPVPIGEYGHVSFQKGPVREKGFNGCDQEDLLVIIIDRLRFFQAGAFACRENAIALTKCEEALLWLQSRTKNRIQRGVEGTNVL